MPFEEDGKHCRTCATNCWEALLICSETMAGISFKALIQTRNRSTFRVIAADLGLGIWNRMLGDSATAFGVYSTAALERQCADYRAKLDRAIIDAKDAALAWTHITSIVDECDDSQKPTVLEMQGSYLTNAINMIGIGTELVLPLAFPSSNTAWYLYKMISVAFREVVVVARMVAPTDLIFAENLVGCGRKIIRCCGPRDKLGPVRRLPDAALALGIMGHPA